MPCCKNRTLLLTQPTQVLKKKFFFLSFFYSKANFVSFSCFFFFSIVAQALKKTGGQRVFLLFIKTELQEIPT